MDLPSIEGKLHEQGLGGLFAIDTTHPFGLVGSFLLSVKYPEVNFGDIDVQCHVDDMDKVKAHLIQLTGAQPITRDVNKGYEKIHARFQIGKVDLVVLNCEVIDNVRDFDLTCCQNFYDGMTVHVLHPDHLNSKTFQVGKLKHEHRIKLYIDRGFTQL